MSNTVSFHPGEETIIHEEPLKNVEPFVENINSVFNMKIHQSKVHLSDANAHDVVFNVTFAMAVPGVFANTRGNESFSTRNSSVDPLRNNNQYFHVEFDLFDKEITKEPYKTDVAFYGTYGKIYPDRSDSQVIPTWSDGEDTWLCWIQRFQLRLTNQHVQSLCNHKITVNVWDTKDKCAPKVRFDHPKPPKAANRSKSTNELTSWIKQSVMMISHYYAKSAAFLENSDRILPHQIISSVPGKKVTDNNQLRNKSSRSSATTKSTGTSPDSICKEKSMLVIYGEPKEDVNGNLGSYAQLEKLLDSKLANKTQIDRKPVSSAKKLSENLSARFNDLSNIIRSESRKSATTSGDVERYNKVGRISLDVRTAELFLLDHTVSRTPLSINTLEDMFCMVSIESSILSSEQSKELNPLVINIRKIVNLPNRSNDFNEINKSYLPMYCEYQFCDLKPYQTVSRLHSKNVRFDDVNVILLGTIDRMNLKSQMQNSFLTIKLFDRIEKQDEKECEDEFRNDMSMGDINITSSRPTVTKPIINVPRGEAKIDLSDIVKKRLKYLEVMVPICPASVPTISHDMELNRKSPEDNNGTYFEAGTTVKVSFKLAKYLDLSAEVVDKKYYNRIILVNNNIKCDFITKMVGIEILKHNCERLNFKSSHITEMQTFLYSTIKECTENDDLFTGVYIIDRKCEVLIIESNQGNINALYESCCCKLDEYQDKFSEDLKFLYNESLLSAERGNFQILTMLPLLLSRDMSFYVSQPLLYVRDMVPRECVEGICKIKELINTDSMHIALRNNLIPTSQMVESIAQYLCSHITNAFEDDSKKVGNKKDNVNNVTKVERKEIKTAPLGERQKMKPHVVRTKTNLSTHYVSPKKECEFIYSSQALNSVSSAKQIIRQQMDPNRRYTYSQTYLFSGSFDPVDFDDECRAEENHSKSEPKWNNSDPRVTIEDTMPQSRRDDLQMPWVENSLHKSFMEPTLPERDQCPYKFDLYIRPLKILDRDSNSIMPSYLEQIQLNKKRKKVEHSTWQRKVCVSDIKFKTHRLLTETEMTDRGRTASNQIAKLEGLRKSGSCAKERYDVNSIPATYVIPVSQEVNHSYTVGPNKYRNLLVNYVPVIEKDRDFYAVYQPSKETSIHRNLGNNIQTQFESPFSVYC